MLSTESNAIAFAVLRDNVARYAHAGALSDCHDARRPPDGANFDYVDLDPYGSPLPFLDAAMTALGPDGVLGVTATDMMVLAGVESGAAERKYGSRPVRGRLAPEAGLRILLASLARRARTVRRRIVPLLCYVHDHHVRAYVRLTEAREVADDPIASIEASNWNGPSLTGAGPWGPFWLGPLFDPQIVAALEPPAEPADSRSLNAWIATWNQEVDADRPFYYESNELARVLKLPSPPRVARLLDALQKRGFRSARTRVRPGAFRTTAARGLVEEVARDLGAVDHSQNARVRA